MLNELIKNYPDLEPQRDRIQQTIEVLTSCYKKGGKVLICGNGGSAADCEHIVGELMKGFMLKREVKDMDIPEAIRVNLQGSLAAVSLVGALALQSAFANDVNPEFIFAQQVFGLGKPGDVLIGISTSGNAQNVAHAIKVANAKGLKTIALTGSGDSTLSAQTQIAIQAPAKETYRVQEYHLPIYHAICAEVEKKIFG